MKNKLLLAAGMAAAAVFASPAVAQDEIASDNFTGPRVEGRFGVDNSNISIKDTRDFNDRGQFASGSTASDLSIGAEAGFDIQSGRLVFGGYAAYDESENDEPFPDRRVTIETGRSITAGGRVGYTVTPNVLLYAKGGYSNTRFRPQFTTGATAAQIAAFNGFERNQDGFHLGGGAEFAVRDGFYGRLDYAHHIFDDYQVDANNELSIRRNHFTASIGFRF
jgi:outer membrane immunogenic protein